MEHILKQRTEELSNCKKLLTSCELQLRELRYEINLLKGREEKRAEDFKIEIQNSKATITELRSHIANIQYSMEEKKRLISTECERLLKLVASLQRIVVDGNTAKQLTPRTSHQILQKICTDIASLKDGFLSQNIEAPILSNEHYLASKLPSLGVDEVISLLPSIASKSLNPKFCSFCHRRNCRVLIAQYWRCATVWKKKMCN